MSQRIHPLSLLFMRWRMTEAEGMAQLEAGGWLDNLDLPEQEEPYRIAQVPLQYATAICRAQGEDWLVPADWRSLNFYVWKSPWDAWRAALPEGDPRKDPAKYRQLLSERNQHYCNEEPEDYDHRARQSRRA